MDTSPSGRGVSDEAEVKRFLNPSIKEYMPNPSVLNSHDQVFEELDFAFGYAHWNLGLSVVCQISFIGTGQALHSWFCQLYYTMAHLFPIVVDFL